MTIKTALTRCHTGARNFVTGIREQASATDRWIAIVIMVVLSATALTLAYNALFFQFVRPDIGKTSFERLGLGLFLWAVGLFITKDRPYLGNLIIAIGFSQLFWGVMGIGACSLFVTPFTHVIDFSLIRFDELLGFHQSQFMDFINQNDFLFHAMRKAYGSWVKQTMGTVVILGLWGCPRVTRLWLLSALITLLIGGLIYFFLPSLPPAEHFMSPYFMDTSFHLIARFDRIHHHLPYHFDPRDGLIVFPSFHVCQALINTIALWWAQRHATRMRWLLIVLAILLTLINGLLTVSTLAIGFHYLADVIGGAALACLSLWVAHRISRKRQESRCVWPS